MSSVEAAIRDYLRADESVMSILVNEDRRMDMEWRGDPRAGHATINLAGGGFDDYVPLRTAVLYVNCYGGSRPAASSLAEAVALSVRRITLSDAPLASASVESVAWKPTPDGVPRYVVTAVVTARFSPVAA